MSILLAWLGNTDLRASEGSGSDGQGPILGATAAFAFKAVHLLSDHDAKRACSDAKWLGRQTSAFIRPHQVDLTSTTFPWNDSYRAGSVIL